MSVTEIVAVEKGPYFMGLYIQCPTHNITVRQGNRVLKVSGVMSWHEIRDRIDLDDAFLEWEAQALAGMPDFEIIS